MEVSRCTCIVLPSQTRRVITLAICDCVYEVTKKRPKRTSTITTASRMLGPALASALSLQAAAFAPVGSGPALRRVEMHGARIAMDLQINQRLKSAALGAALAASLSASAANAADPWPYSTLLGKVQSDEVAKVRAPPHAPRASRPIGRKPWGGIRHRRQFSPPMCIHSVPAPSPCPAITHFRGPRPLSHLT